MAGHDWLLEPLGRYRLRREIDHLTPPGYLLPPLPQPADNAAMEVEPTKAEPAKRKRRWFQFSLRSLLIGVTLLAILCPAATWVVRDRQRLIREQEQLIHDKDDAKMQAAIAVQNEAVSRRQLQALRADFRELAVRLNHLRQQLEPRPEVNPSN